MKMGKMCIPTTFMVCIIKLKGIRRARREACMGKEEKLTKF
jgi:hypothetical protein